MYFIIFFRTAFLTSLLFHFVVVQPEWVLIAWTFFTGLGFYSSWKTYKENEEIDGKRY